MVALIALLLGVALARFHATLLASEPAANAVLATAPPGVRLVFSEPVEAQLSSVRLLLPNGSEEGLAVGADPHDVHALVAPVPSLARGRGRGTYRVDWRVVSADGHPVSGSFAFAVESASPAAMAAVPEHAADTVVVTAARGPAVWGAPPLAALSRGLALAALMALAGLLALGEWVLPNAEGTRARAVRWLAGAAVVLLVAHAGFWLANLTAGSERSFGETARAALGASGSGRREVVRIASVLLALWAVALARRPGIAACCALIALLVSGAIGHAAALHPLVAVPTKGIHLLAGALWLGGLLWIVLASPLHPRYGDGVRRISAIALGAVVLVGASGVVQSLLFLPTAAAMVTSPYGWLSLTKVAGFLILVGFGAYHRYVFVPRLARGGGGAATPLRASVRREVSVMLLVILIGGLLSYVPPNGR